MKRMLIVAGAVLGSALALPTMAETETTTFEVTAEVLATCEIEATDLDFGNYTPGGGDVTGSSDVTVKCTDGTDFDVKLDGGEEGDIAQRLMTDGTYDLEYNLYLDAALENVWGEAAGEIASSTGAGFSAPETFTVYGELPDTPANQDVGPGSYADTITATVDF